MKNIKPEEISKNPVNLIGKGWMLISAGDRKSFNAMTASWGGLGFMWNKPVAIAMVRTNRHTFKFLEEKEFATLSFYDEKYRPQLKMFGSTSGRDIDKTAASGFTAQFTENNAPYYKEANLVLECKKLYSQMLEKQNFADAHIPELWYAKDDFHKMYYFEIVNAFEL